MKIMNKILIAFIAATSVCAVSTSAFAGDQDRAIVAPADAINIVVSKLQSAKSAVASGLIGDRAAAMIQEAKDANKNIKANDKVDIARAKASRFIQAAQDSASQGRKDDTIKNLDQAISAYEGLKKLL